MQIGPRIRVGGTVGKIGEGIKKIIPSPASIVGGIVGGGAGSLIGSAVNHSVGDDIKKGVTNASVIVPAAAAAGRAGGGAPIPNAGGGDSSGVEGDGMPAGGDTAQNWAKTLLEFGGDAVKAATAFAQRYGQTALELLAIKNAADRQTQADKYATGALADTQQRFADKAGLRSSGISGLMNPGTGADLSSLKSMAGAQSGNPFAGAVTPHLPPIPNAAPAAPKPQAPAYNPTAGAALPIAAPPTLAMGTNPATGQRPQAPIDKKKVPIPVADRFGSSV